MNEKLLDLIYKLLKENIINLLFSAIDEMQSYNGRSIQDCILISMGATDSDEKPGKWKLPTIKEIKKNTKNFPLV